MEKETVKYLMRTPTELDDRAKKKAAELGLSKNTYINSLIEWDNPVKEKPKFRPRPEATAKKK